MEGGRPGRGGGAGRRLFGETVLQAVVGEFRVVAQVHLFEQSGAVNADCLYAEVERLGDFRRGFAGGDHAQGLIFAVGELFVGQSFAVFADGVGELFGEGGADIFFAAGDLTDGGDEEFRRALFGEIARSAGLEGADGMSVSRKSRP